MKFIGFIVILSLFNFSLSLSIRKHGNKINSIPSEEIDLWFTDHLPESPKIIETITSFSSSSAKPSTSVTFDDEKVTGEGLPPNKQFSSSESSINSRPVITLKNNSEAIPFTRVDATLKGSGESNPDSADKVESGVGPASEFDYDPESETGFSSIPSGSSSSSSASSSIGPEDNTFETGDLKIEISDLKPVYIKPPSGFKPILYPNREMDGIHPMGAPFFDAFSSTHSAFQPKVTLPPPKEPYPYPYPFGLTSWSLGGIRGIQRGGFWESMGSDAALGLPMRPFKGNPVSVVEWINLDASSSGSKESNTNYKPPLPPPVSSPSSLHPEIGSIQSNKPSLSSWMFGGLRQFSPFTWQMPPPMVIEKFEYVPLSTSSSSSSSSASSSQSSKVPSNINSYWIISDNEANPAE